jgi:hypothetical protein
MIGCGVMLIVTMIQAQVWEGGSIWGYIAQVYLSTYVGLWTLGIVIHDYRLVHYGLPSNLSRPLTPEQIEPIRRALEDHDWTAAINRYREVVPDAGLGEAKQYVVRLFFTLRAQYPDKFATPPLSLASLNWNAILICAAIEAVFLGVLWFAMPPSHPASAISQFVYSLLFGIGVIAGMRVKGLWKLLLLAPAVAVMILSEVIVPRLAEASSHSIGPYLLGFLFGPLLMVSAFTPRRRRV